jgi:hypothetical protein
MIEVKKLYKLIPIRFPDHKTYLYKCGDTETVRDCIHAIMFNNPTFRTMKSPGLFVFRGPMIEKSRILWGIPLPKVKPYLKFEFVL